jgi:succinate-semialdehyde dehydrogenase / glutarate-semialdehyde dehydrogenase
MLEGPAHRPPVLARVAELVQLVRVPPERPRLISLAPFTGEPLAAIPLATADDVRAAVERARAAQAAWSTVPPRERARVVLRFHDRLLARQHEILDLIQLETGKARLHAFEEVADCANQARYLGVHGPAILKPRRRQPPLPVLTSATERRHPIGVVGFIVPWNYPLNLTVTDALAALVAGNAAVIRPDPQTSLTALWAVELLRTCGLPDDVLIVVTGDGADLGPPLIESVDYIMFTGSTEVGRVVARAAAARLIGSSLELGGKNAMIVRRDADLRRAVDGAVRGAFVGAGQVCVSVERIYIVEPLFEQFVTRVVERTGRLRLGRGLDWASEVGSLGSRRQLDRVVSHVEDARARGAEVLVGGRPRPDIGPLFYEPTILARLQPSMLAYAAETFGPVAAVYPVEDDEAALAAANASMYGLNASIWTRNVAEGRRLATRLRAGSVNVNEAYAAAWGAAGAPVGGMKHSGSGRRHGVPGLLKFTESQTVATQRLVSLAPAGNLRAERFASAVTWALRVRRHMPLVR